MPRCPNCSYELVLLPNRRKFKCAKCGKLFYQKPIEDQEFNIWNQKQRETDQHNLKIEQKQKKEKLKLTEEEKRQRKAESQERYRLKNIEKIKAYNRTRDRRQDQKARYHRELDRLRLEGKLKYWRQTQAKLAQQELQFNCCEPNPYGLEDSFSTFGLSELLSVVCTVLTVEVFRWG